MFVEFVTSDNQHVAINPDQVIFARPDRDDASNTELLLTNGETLLIAREYGDVFNALSIARDLRAASSRGV